MYSQELAQPSDPGGSVLRNLTIQPFDWEITPPTQIWLAMVLVGIKKSRKSIFQPLYIRSKTAYYIWFSGLFHRLRTKPCLAGGKIQGSTIQWNSVVWLCAENNQCAGDSLVKRICQIWISTWLKPGSRMDEVDKKKAKGEKGGYEGQEQVTEI